MAYAISVRSDNDSSEGIRSLWRICGALEKSPSMEAMMYPPHITFAIYDEIPLPDLFSAFDAATQDLKRVTIRFDSLNYFEAPHAVVVWAAPNISKQLNAVHASIHNGIDPNLCHVNYRPENWVPHCSLATTIDLDRRDEALAFVGQEIDPVEVIFDMADCATFMPVKVLKETSLGF